MDIYRAHYDTHMDFGTGKQTFTWHEPENLGEKINTPDGWEIQPTLSADGRTIYFATVRKGSRSTDIFQSTRDDKGVWSKAVPMPGPITTDGDEKAPFLHSDSHTLYFAARPPKNERGQEGIARGHRGVGGYDIFYSHLGDDGKWSTPKNIGNPINTTQDHRRRPRDVPRARRGHRGGERPQQYDLELIFFPPRFANNIYALPNKFFEAIQGRPGVVIGESPEIVGFVREHGFGLVVEGWTGADLAAALNALTPEQIAAMKQAADRAASDFSTRGEGPRFLAEVGA